MTADRPIKCDQAKKSRKMCAFKLVASRYGFSRLVQGECLEHGGFLIISLTVITVVNKGLIETSNTPISAAKGIHRVD